MKIAVLVKILQKGKELEEGPEDRLSWEKLVREDLRISNYFLLGCTCFVLQVIVCSIVWFACNSSFLSSRPPTPPPSPTGRYEDVFIEGRMRQLQMWINRMTQHPIISDSAVFKHFLTCTDEKVTNLRYVLPFFSFFIELYGRHSNRKLKEKLIFYLVISKTCQKIFVKSAVQKNETLSDI